MKVSDKGLYAIAVHEGIVPAPYLDPVNVWTFGIGHAETSGLDPNPRHMPKGMPQDVDAAIQKAFDLLRDRIVPYEQAVARAVTVPLEQHEFDALASFHFNTGAITKASATRVLNEGGNKREVARRLALYNKAGGDVLEGLVKRRQEENAMFLDAKYPIGPIPVWNVTSAHKIGRIIRRIGEAEAMSLMRTQGPSASTHPDPAEHRPTGFAWLLTRIFAFLTKGGPA